VTAPEIPATGTADVHVLHQGYVGLDGDEERVSGTVTLIADSGVVIVVDPGMVPSREALLAALRSHGFEPDSVTDVVFTAEDISTVAATADEVYVCTHAGWSAAGPEADPLATDPAALTASRELLRSFATMIIPGHGAPFRPGSRL
jgi:glyoxylase-like metal-dependent hydrolase (beta-lactamase superfamily II)